MPESRAQIRGNLTSKLVAEASEVTATLPL